MYKADKIQQKIWKAFGKAGKKLGKPFELYRSAELTNPIQAKNYLDTKFSAFSLDEKFKRPPSESMPMWQTWVDGRLETHFDIQRGDFLYSPELNETYMIASAELHNTIQSIKCESTISLIRSGYSDSGSGFAPGDTEVATSIPCSIQIGSPAGGHLGYIPAGTHLDESLQTAVIYTWDPANEIAVRDAITDNNSRRWNVLATEQTDVGTKLTVRAFNP